MKLNSILAALAMSAAGTAALADGHCSNDVPISTLTNAFPAYEVMTQAMAACGNVTSELDKDHRLKVLDAFSANPAIYTMASATNAMLTPLIDAQVVRPLDDLVEKYGQSLNPNQFIRIDGKIMAISAQVNTQHLMYREDILADLGIPVPTTWEELIAAGKKIQEAGAVDYPYGSYYKPGWNLGFVFINHYLGEGGEFFDETGRPAIDRAKAETVLNRMKDLAALMDPEYLVSDSTFVTKQLQQGKIALANLWASRAAAVNDPAESSVSGKIVMGAGLMGSETVASTIWWDGWVIGTNVSDAEAEAAFQMLMVALGEDTVKANNDVAIWLAPGFEPGAAAVGAIKTAELGAPNYPGTKVMAAMHDALGAGLAPFLTGEKDAAQTIDDIEAAYLTDAGEKGLLK